ncbi:YfbK domain-containing protein [Phnomibacter sp.]|uniref:YfbK domain-containing protein n=1 Tax=Phnomibacter sp. TaxID=2836217 RepID=UPI002FDED8F8
MTNLFSAMSNQDKFFESFKDAARHTEEQRFDGFDAVWQRVEQRLDEQQQPKAVIFQWKRILSIAAAAIVILMLGIWRYNATAPTIAPSVDVVKVEPVAPTVPQDTAASIASISNTPAPASVRENEEASPQKEIAASNTTSTNTGNQLQEVATVLPPAAPTTVQDTVQTVAIAKPAETLTSGLDEVVVTGSVSAKKKSMAVAQSKQEQQQRRELTQALQGRVAGLDVRSNQAVPPKPSSNFSITGAATQVRIRGAASLNANDQPLYVLNGVPVSDNYIKKINPAEIESIDVLKDGKASAIYGSRAAQGVVVINTKKRSKKEDAQVDKLKLNLQQIGVSAENGRLQIEPYPIEAESYNPFVENPFTNPALEPLSTFSIDVDNASYSNVRRFINNGEQVPPSAVKIEEMVNYFKYNYAAPTGNMPFAMYTEYSQAPWNNGHTLLRVALKAKELPQDDLPASNLVFLIDVSGSMNEPNKLPLLKQSMKVLIKKLRAVDRVAIVVYAGAAGVVLPSTSAQYKDSIIQAIDKLAAGGSTAGGEGIDLAYKIAVDNFIKKGNNRIVLATDGDFNVGISSTGDLQKLIAQKRQTGVYLTCLGFGDGNYRDDVMESLAEKGNGNYAYIDNLQEANRVLGKEFAGTVHAVAKDVKIQIEFNPQHVQRYRLLGYETRMLKAEDFANDTIDAGELGSGHVVTALYEIIPTGADSKFLQNEPILKYNNRDKNNTRYQQELATIKFRYKLPQESKSTEGLQVIDAQSQQLDKSSNDFRFAAAVAWFGLVLRHSELIGEFKLEDLIHLARYAKDTDIDGYRSEFVRLVETWAR